VPARFGQTATRTLNGGGDGTLEHLGFGTVKWRRQRDHKDRSLRVAASAIGGAALPAGIGPVIRVFDAKVLVPSLLVLGLAVGGIYGLLSHLITRSQAIAA